MLLNDYSWRRPRYLPDLHTTNRIQWVWPRISWGHDPFEVPVILGSSLVELADINLAIAVGVWDAYGGLTWAERN